MIIEIISELENIHIFSSSDSDILGLNDVSFKQKEANHQVPRKCGYHAGGKVMLWASNKVENTTHEKL